MTKITAFIRTSKKNPKLVNVRFRLRDAPNTQLFHSSDIAVDPNIWSNKIQGIKDRVLCANRTQISNDIHTRKNLILDIYANREVSTPVSSAWLELEVDKKLHPDKFGIIDSKSFFDIFNDFVGVSRSTKRGQQSVRVVFRALQRFELLKRVTFPKFAVTYDGFSGELLREFELFLRNEVDYAQAYPHIYEAIKECRSPAARGQNTIAGILNKLRSFFIWSVNNNKTTKNPFAAFSIGEAVYGTPYYITIDERNKIYQCNLSRHRQLAVQRDIFVFQCLIGCRVGDLLQMTRANVIDEAIEYIPRKTKEGRPITVRVPLNKTAKEILSRYPTSLNEELLPFISAQKYNNYIKLAFKAARINRMVTVINPTTRVEEKQKLSDIASSHIARRTFIGNLYKKVKDPNLVGSLSGHKEGSRAFARYREIDDEIKTELVNMLE